MKKLQLGLFGLSVVMLLIPSMVQGAPIITAGIVDTDGVNDSVFDVPTFQPGVVATSDGGAGGSNGSGIYIIGTDESYPQYEYWSYDDEGNEEGYVNMTGVLDPDPLISFGITAIDSGAPSSFTFSYVLPLVPLVNNPSIVFDSLSGSVTNGAAAGAMTVTALGPPAGIPDDGDGIVELQTYTLSDDGGVTWENVLLDAGPTTTYGPPFPGFASGLYGPYNQGPIATIPTTPPGGSWTHMRVDIRFRLQGGGDTFTLNGAKVLIPEPGTFCIGLSAVALCGLFRRRR